MSGPSVAKKNKILSFPAANDGGHREVGPGGRTEHKLPQLRAHPQAGQSSSHAAVSTLGRLGASQFNQRRQ
jgi:hypothetical protein